MDGVFLLVLHSHLPYVRGAGRWPHGEEWVHEAILGTYLPLLIALTDLHQEGVPFRLTIGLTPTLLEQLAHPEIASRFLEYVADQVTRADAEARDAASEGRRRLAERYAHTYRDLLRAFSERFSNDLPAAFASLARAGHLEILASAATHGYLPLLDEASVHAQLALGRAVTRRVLDVEPTGLWLPECAYRPGLERILEDHGVAHFFTDAALLAAVVGTTDGESENGLPRSGGLAASAVGAASPAADSPGTDRAYLVGSSTVAVVPRDPDVSGQVWSAQVGYPGDGAYREFHRKDERSGLRYWRVTDIAAGLADKAEYDPAAAAERVRTHAAHFGSVVRAELAAATARSGRPALIAATFDTELFGHWWFEGVDWLALVLRSLADVSATAAESLEAVRPRERVRLREGSWGKRSDHSTWANADTSWMWDELGRMSGELSRLREHPPDGALRARAARQAVRELLLAQSSDWPFLHTTGQAADYAIERFRSHAVRFQRMVQLAHAGTAADESELRSLERADDPFPDASLAAFAAPVRA
jgi:1,4-alpha-glucan branching enzyme